MSGCPGLSIGQSLEFAGGLREEDHAVALLHQVARFSDRGLTPLTTYYYTVFTADDTVPPTYYVDRTSSVAARATRAYGIPQQLYDLLPAVHRRYDLPLSESDLAAYDERQS